MKKEEKKLKNSELISLLKEFTIEDALVIEEFDEQYKALKYLFKNIKDEILFVMLVILNSLVSYQLSKRGEEYWWDFSKYFSKTKIKNLEEDFIEFLKKYNKRLLNAKIKRIKKAVKFVENLDKNEIMRYSKNLEKFAEDLANIMNQKVSDKTIVFATKMFGYSLGVLGFRIIFPFNLDIPLDSRLKKISDDLSFWKNLSKEINIPPLHLDSIIWVTLGISDDKIDELPEKTAKKVRKLRSFLKETFIN